MSNRHCPVILQTFPFTLKHNTRDHNHITMQCVIQNKHVKSVTVSF